MKFIGNYGIGRWLISLLVVIVIALVLLVPLRQTINREKERINSERLSALNGKTETLVPVVTTTLQPVTVEDRIRLPGMIAAVMEVTLTAEVSGKVMETPVPDGAAVKKGDLLCRIDETDYRVALERAEASLKFAATERRRLQGLVEQKMTAQADLDQAESNYLKDKADVDAAAAALARCRITSPFDGILNNFIPEAGDIVSRGQTLGNLLDLHRVKVEVGIPEKDIDAIRNLSECEIRVDAIDGGLRLKGKKTYLSYKPLESSMVYILRLEVENPDLRLRPGMFVTTDVIKNTRPNAFLVPLFAVLAREDGDVVYLAEEQAAGRWVARKCAVTLGIFQGRYVEVISSLKAGDRLIVMGQRAVEDGLPVNIIRSVKDISELMR